MLLTLSHLSNCSLQFIKAVIYLQSFVATTILATQSSILFWLIEGRAQNSTIQLSPLFALSNYASSLFVLETEFIQPRLTLNCLCS